MGLASKCGPLGLVACIFTLVVIAAIVAGVVVSQNNDGISLPFGNTNSSSGMGEDDSPPAASPVVAPPTTSAPTVPGFQACNGLENLCGVRVNDMLFATLHNAMSTAEDGTPFFYNHELSLEKALEAGWRGINVDIGKCDGAVAMVHSDCDLLGFRDPVEVFTNVYNFLQSNKNDVVLMPVQIDFSTGGEVTLQEIWDVMQQASGFTDLLYEHPGRGTPWPTMEELIDADTRILLFHYNGERCDGNSGCPSPALHDWFDYAAETNFELNSVAEVSDTATSCVITRGQNGERDFFGVNLFTSSPAANVCAQLNSATFVAPFLTDCSTINGGERPNLILVDCWDVGDILEVVQQYNLML